WICTSHKPITRTNGDKDYYQMTIGSRTDGTRRRVYMHRYIYTIYHGEIKEGLVVRHKCDNTLCINPNHLELGTHKDNMNDMKIRNRALKGEKNHRHKLSNREVEEIRELYKNNKYNQTELGKMFDVSQRQISNIVRFKNR